MSKNTRWALAIIGVVIIIVGAIVIGTGKDNTDAVQTPNEQTTTETGSTQSVPVAPPTGSTGASGGGNSGSGNNSNSGGASPSDPKTDTGGGTPAPGAEQNDSGGAEAKTDSVSPILSDVKVQTVVASKGDRVMIRGLSDSDGEMHVHGYDKEVALKAGKIARVRFTATIDGEFPIEFHLASGDIKVGTLRVNP